MAVTHLLYLMYLYNNTIICCSCLFNGNIFFFQMSKYSAMGYEHALVLVATLMAIMAVSVVAVPAAHHLHHHSNGHHRMMSVGSGAAGSSSGIDHPLSKRSFFDIQCKGVYDKTIFARLDRVCEDCYNLFREPQLHTLCRFASSLSRPVRPVTRNPSRSLTQ